MKIVTLFIAAGIVAGNALAKVESSGPAGFSLAYEADISLPPSQAYAKWLRLGEWWSDDHTYSGKAGNITLDPVKGGCWCEVNGAGFVQHMAVINVLPEKLLVLQGGLGPLQFMGVAGSLSVAFEPAGQGTHVTMRYAVGGYDPDGFAKLPALVDGVMNEGFERYRSFAVRP